MTLAQMIERARQELAAAIATRQTAQDALMALREDPNLTEDAVNERTAARDGADQAINTARDRVTELETELARENEVAELARSVQPTGTRAPAYDHVARVGSEPRTYRQDNDRRGVGFVSDIAARFLGDFSASTRLERHMQEEFVERGGQVEERAIGTGAVSGLIVPQYLTDMFAPMATAGRPFADACRPHDLPATGMNVYIGRGTTGTSVANQSSENGTVSETDYDDTLLTIPVKTAAGSQTVSRQGVDRGVNVEDTILQDLYNRNRANLDSTLINESSTGLTNVASTVAYTDASPTTAELYPKVIQALAGVEAALMDVASGDNLAVMHSRRWYWMQNAMGSSWPVITQPGIIVQTLGANYAEAYGRGVRGILPNGTPVIVDNNIATGLGAGTNEDEIYLVDRQECHLWEDPAAPFYIRAEQPKAKSLGIDMVVYCYYAYTFQRYAHSQKIGGTGLVTPAFTGA